MFVLMRCLHKAGQGAARDEHRPAHRAWVASGGNGLVSVLVGSAILTESGETAGNFGILEARSLEDARKFAEGDAFNLAGIVETIELTPLPDTFQAHRITDPMSPRLETAG